MLIRPSTERAARPLDGALRLLRDLIHERTGLLYDDDHLDALDDKLAPLAEERGSFSVLDYYYLLKYDAAAGAEWLRVMDALAVPETYFWREVAQLRAVVDHVVPAAVARLAGRPLRIWSVPCAGGEEPLTLAMLLEDAGWFARAPIELHGSDASPAAVARARSGLYRDRAFRTLPAHLQQRYFRPEGRGWRVDPALQARIHWSVVNLAEPAEAAPLADSPIVLCRNLFIYFSPDAIRRTVRMFAERMPTPGYLCLGVSESLLRLTADFELEDVGGAFMYVKRAEPIR